MSSISSPMAKGKIKKLTCHSFPGQEFIVRSIREKGKIISRPNANGRTTNPDPFSKLYQEP